jgi:hypothetical protein
VKCPRQKLGFNETHAEEEPQAPKPQQRVQSLIHIQPLLSKSSTSPLEGWGCLQDMPAKADKSVLKAHEGNGELTYHLARPDMNNFTEMALSQGEILRGYLKVPILAFHFCSLILERIQAMRTMQRLRLMFFHFVRV